MVVALAAGFRLYRLGEWPPGPYRDEAYNGLDALAVLKGHHALFFPANNGREPIYIYLVALSVALFGPTVFALRLPAALAGTLATLPAFLLGREWFGRVAGLIAAYLWAITFWPVHLGRIGLRAGLLAPLLALALWLGTRAYRRRQSGLWLAAGIVYGLSFYTYLAVRFTPLLLVLFAVYLVGTGRRARLWDGGRVLWFAAGATLAVAPLAAVFLADPALIIGRAGQVSILSSEINGGNPVGALLGNIGRAVGMYLWRGDTILRHNGLLAYDTSADGNLFIGGYPAGRPVFDWLMAGPFLAGALSCLRHWRRPPATFLLLWQLVMLGPTILAEDAPHFLRATGVLPGAVLFPAIGLALLWEWPRIPPTVRRAVVVLLLAGSLILTTRDYTTYAQQPDVAYLWESAAAELARSAAKDTTSATVFIDERFIEGFPSVQFLLGERPVTTFRPGDGLPAPLDKPAVIYAWPYDPLDFLSTAVAPPALVEVSPGPLGRGDLEREAYSLYTRYAITPNAVSTEPGHNFAGAFRLRDAAAALTTPDELALTFNWERGSGLATGGGIPNLFIHVIGPEGTLAQYDGPLAGGLWPGEAWQPGIQVGERHVLSLPRPLDSTGDEVQIGLYWPDTGERLPVSADDGRPIDDKIVIGLEP